MVTQYPLYILSRSFESPCIFDYIVYIIIRFTLRFLISLLLLKNVMILLFWARINYSSKYYLLEIYYTNATLIIDY
jgi:hypothetical protein